MLIPKVLGIFLLSFSQGKQISQWYWKIISNVEFWYLPLRSSSYKLVNFKIPYLKRFFNFDEKFVFFGQTWVGRIHQSELLEWALKLFQIRRFWTTKNRYQPIFWCQTLPKINPYLTLSFFNFFPKIPLFKHFL